MSDKHNYFTYPLLKNELNNNEKLIYNKNVFPQENPSSKSVFIYPYENPKANTEIDNKNFKEKELKDNINNKEDNDFKVMKEFEEIMKESKPKKDNIFDINSPSYQLGDSEIKNKYDTNKGNNDYKIFDTDFKDDSYKSDYEILKPNTLNKLGTSKFLLPETNLFDNYDKKAPTDEEILNKLLKLSSDIDKPVKKENNKTNKSYITPLIIPSTKMIDLSKGKYGKNEDNKESSFGFFDNFEKELNSQSKNNFEFDIDIKNKEGKLNLDLENKNVFGEGTKKVEKLNKNKFDPIKSLNSIENKSSSISPLELNLETNLNHTSQKLDKEIKRIPISLAQFDIRKEENGINKKKDKVYI